MDPETIVTDLGHINSRLLVACQMKYNGNRVYSRLILGLYVEEKSGGGGW